MNYENVCLGKKLGRVVDPRTLQMGEFMPPAALDSLKIPSSWRIGKGRHTVPMYANADFGVCTLSSNGHRIVVQQAAVGQGKEIEVTDDDVLDAYSAITGFRRDDPSTDNGAYMLDVANYMRKTGLGRERDGTPHTIDAFIEVQRTRLEHVRAGMMLFGGLWMGVWLPDSAKHQGVWDVPEGGPIGEGQPGSWGGHAVEAVGYDSHGLTIYTWGREQRLTWQFFSAYVDEAYVFITEDYLRRVAQTTPRGFDTQRLNGYLAELAA
jgi:hypothetical protein